MNNARIKNNALEKALIKCLKDVFGIWWIRVFQALERASRGSIRDLEFSVVPSNSEWFVTYDDPYYAEYWYFSFNLRGGGLIAHYPAVSPELSGSTYDFRLTTFEGDLYSLVVAAFSSWDVLAQKQIELKNKCLEVL